MTSTNVIDGAREISQEEYQAFLKSSVVETLSESARMALLSSMQHRHIPAGQRFITQGDEGSEFFIIRDGECFVTIEVDGTNRVVGRLGPGDVVGEMAALTGEKRNANVDAETDMALWAITRPVFDTVCERFPRIRELLTRIVSDRLSRSLFIGDRTVGKYTVHRAIGTGGCSVVYHGRHSTLEIPVAVKMLKHHLAMQPDFVERFRNEAKIIAKLNHENIVKVFDIEEMFRTFFIVMELVAGESLSAVLRRQGKLPLPRAVDYLLQICRGLLHAHESGIVHSDVKPGNVIVQQGDRVKIIDFGFSAPVGSQDQFVGGTDLYVSPEHIQRRPLDERSDIYSLGLTAYEMLTGVRPCDEYEKYGILNWHLEQDVKDPRKVGTDLPGELADFVIRASRRDPDLRYSDLKQVLSDLEPVARKLGIRTSTVETDQHNMMGLFLLYRDEQQETMQRLVQSFSRELGKVGARLWATDIKNLIR
jgi:eukaryotic-like serine/threonine-protein kinase